MGVEALTTGATDLEQNASVAPQPTTPELPSLGLALSGGGVRAALFSLGVIVALIETQYHKRVACIASVSGGSILNAALAHARRLGELSTVDEFQSLVSSLTTILAEQGTFALSWPHLRRGAWVFLQFGWRALIAIVPAALFGFAFLSDHLRQDYNFDLPHLLAGVYRQIPWGPTAAIAATILMGTLLYKRGLFQEAVFRDVVKAGIASRTDSVNTPQLQNWGAPAVENAPEVMHVLVATDLLSGEPMYFSGQFVYCKPYGWGTPNNLLTTEAIYSSAAFPVVFPPKRLRLKRLSFHGGEMQGDALPRSVRLVDGGVYNNLGTDWFNVLTTEWFRVSRGKLFKPFGGLPVALPPRIEAENIIVVNAGAPSRSVRRLLPGPFAISRIMSVLYDNTVRPRVDLLRNANYPLIDITQSPLDLAESLERMGTGGSRAKELARAKERARAKELADRLRDEFPRQFWEDFSQDNASTPTKLSKTELRRGVRLVLHGYLSTLVLLHIRFGAKLPEQLRNEGDFLAGLTTTSASLPAPNAAV